MPYSSPGVYIKEVSGGVKPIAGVGTSTAAFIGIPERCDHNDRNKATFITSWKQFVDKFGWFFPNGFLAYTVFGFFAEGGTSCWVVPLFGGGAQKATLVPIKGEDDNDVLQVDVLYEGAWGNYVTIIIEEASNNKNAQGSLVDANLFKFIVKYKEDPKVPDKYFGDGGVEVYDRVLITDIQKKVNGISRFITVKTSGSKRPKNDTYRFNKTNTGKDGAPPSTTDYQQGLLYLDRIDEVNIIAIPDNAGDSQTVRDGCNYCKNRKDCFFIAEPAMGKSPADMITYLKAITPSAYGALYYPWVYIYDPLTQKSKLVPPSGIVAGTYAYTDSIRGVHKAPAGIGDGLLDSVSDVEYALSPAQLKELTTNGEDMRINVIRKLPEGICIWGARTLSADPEWPYINVRRLLIYIEKSIETSTQWVVFEPNTPELWGNVKRNLTAFLTRVWRDGALFGTVPEEAFWVKVDEENNPPDVRDLGQLIIEIGVAPVMPAEFVEITIRQKTLSQ